MEPDASLDLAYKYPFSSEARKYVSSLGAKFDASMLGMGRSRVEQALQKSSIGYSRNSIGEVKRKSVLSYVYARMLVSALGSRIAVDKYVAAEAKRSGDALQEETEQNMIRIGKELGISIEYSGSFSMGFGDFLRLSPRNPEYALVRQELDKGVVYMQKYKAARIIQTAIRREIAKGLPIPLKELPKEAVSYAKTIRVPVPKVSVRIDENRYNWIAKLLATPIADVRHRTVNLILAPYLVNVKGMGEEESTKVIVEYIERCKQIDPNTKVNESYIRYQCRYAKQKGSKPLTRDNAAELLRGVVDF